ncbi:FtsX-like permease family protein [Spirosoma sp. HMF3257]|uniref:ABC transporter permease n=1 Tax=Spirosoma telluris TaxID=2183553 RepID=A0A327NKN3_9BACT|nr:FtsX-like permease family protein [Spirosoma telluris]RAI75363.1 ABC transporter permease [Spirosoma telluris]
MLTNYIKIAWRNLWKHKLFSVINIVGLGLAMTFCFIQLIQIRSSFEKDTFHPYPDRTYRLLMDATAQDGNVFHLASTPVPLSEKLKSGYSGIDKTVRVIRTFGSSLSNGIKSLKVNGSYVDPAYFEIFGFKLEKGKPAIEPRTVVLSHETAERFFGNASPIGKTLTQKELGAFTITGVFAPLNEKRTHLQADLVVSMATYPLLNKEVNPNDWLNSNAYTFVLLNKGTHVEALDRALADITNKNARTVDFKGMKGHSYRRQQLSEISPDYENLLNNPSVEPIWKVGVSLLMALIIVSLAGFNYINLTLTRSLSRAREVGVRKVAGAARWQLTIQFLTETVLISFLALVVGYVGLQFMQSFIHVRWLNWRVQNMQLLWVMFIGFTLFTGLLAGLLPARILSSFQAIHILKGDIGPASLGKIGFRKALVVIQFVVALIFMTFNGIANSQFTYMATDNDNFNRKQILNVPLSDSSDFRLLTNEMANVAGVERIGVTSALLNEGSGKAKISQITGKAEAGIDAFIYSVDDNFIDNMRLTFVAGKNLPKSTSDSSSHFVVINEKAVQTLGFSNPRDIVGQEIKLNENDVLIAGVVKNFCFMRYELPVSPLVLGYDPNYMKVLSIQVAENAEPDQLTAALGSVWKKFHPHEAFVYSWYEQQLYEDYKEGGDQKFMAVIVFIVFLIAGLGLLGMVTYSTEKRTKEVGIRKVMGATTTQLMQLLAGDFLKLILIAGTIALPLGYVLGGLFLQIFTYHAQLGPGVFLVCLGSLLLIGLLSIGIQTYRTALSNPAKTLRSE